MDIQKTVMNNQDLTLEDYLNNSGTRSSNPIYEIKKVKFSKMRITQFGLQEIKEPRKIVAIYS